MSGYPQPHGYGGYGSSPPPGQQPYGSTPPAGQPYGSSVPYAAPPPSGGQSYGSSGSYGAPPPSGQPYAPYGAPPSAPYASQSGHQPGQKPPKNKPESDHYGGGHGGGGYPPPPQPYGSGSPFGALASSAFPPGTDPNIVAYFQTADQDGSGLIDDKELQKVLGAYNPSGFSLRTVHLLMYLFTNSNSRKIGPKEFTSVYYSLQSWRAIFDRFDRDRSGKIDFSELREALLSLGFAVPPLVLDLLISKFDKTGGRNNAIEYDNFIECCLTVKGLTEKFKEKDINYSGSATFSYETFMLTVLPFLIA